MFSISLMIKEVQGRAYRGYHLTPTSVAVIQVTGGSGHLQEREAYTAGEGVQGWTLAPHTSRTCTTLCSSNASVCRVYKETQSVSCRDSCLATSLASLFTRAKTWKQSVCSLTDEWRRELWHTHSRIFIQSWKRMKFYQLLQHGRTQRALC